MRPHYISTVLLLSPKRTPGKLVNYFGVLPVEASSGVERDGTPRGPKRFKMSPRGNDLVRRYLWMAALSAAQHNPAYYSWPPGRRAAPVAKLKWDRDSRRAPNVDLSADALGTGNHDAGSGRPSPRRS